MASINQKPLDSKREEFRKYLERTGVMDGFTQVLTALYEETEKPEDALSYVLKMLQNEKQEKTDSDDLTVEINICRERIADLEEKLAAEQEKVVKLEQQLLGLKQEKDVVEGNAMDLQGPIIDSVTSVADKLGAVQAQPNEPMVTETASLSATSS